MKQTSKTVWICFCYLSYLLVAAPSYAQNPAIYTDRGAWVRAVNATGDPKPIGTQTFNDIPAGFYCYLADPGGEVGFASYNGCGVAVVPLLSPPGEQVLRPFIHAVIGIPNSGVSAIGFDVMLEGFICPTPPQVAQVTVLQAGNGGQFGQFGTIASPGFIGFVAAPGQVFFSSVQVFSKCGGQDAVSLLDNVSYPGGAPSSFTNPNPPVPCPPGTRPDGHCFISIGVSGWYDPPVTNAYDFHSTDANFVAINDFPPGFAGPFTVTTGGVTLGAFVPGQSVVFANGGVHDFRISGISPAIDGANPLAFPIKLSLDRVGAMFTMLPMTSTDATPPVITHSVNPVSLNGWSNGSVAVGWTVSDPESGIASTSGCSDTVLSQETPGATLTCSATNNVSLSSFDSVNVKIDKTTPVATAAAAPSPNATGWNNTNVTVSFSGTDTGSGIDFCTGPMILLADGAGQSASGTCTDKAGNVSTPAAVSGINIDKTPPIVTPPAPISIPATQAGGATPSGSSPLAAFLVGGSAADVLDAAPFRMPAQVGGVDVTATTMFALGTTMVTFRFRDGADNIGTATANVTVSPQMSLLRVISSSVWLGLRNSDDQGTQFDLQAEVFKNNVLVTSHLTRCITGVTRNLNSALEAMVQFGSFQPVPYASGDVLSIKISTRIGTNSDDSKCPGHNNATGLRLYYDAQARQSHLGAELAPSALKNFYLHTSASTDFLNDIASTSGTALFKDSPSINFAGGNLWKLIGTWNLTLP